MPYVDKIISLHPLSNYKILVKHPIYEKDSSVEARFKRLKEEFESIGMRRTVEAVILTHIQNLPHVLLLMLGAKFAKMPGGELNPGEDEVEGLKRLLNETFGEENEIQCNWTIKHIVGAWWRPNCETLVYPYCPPHVNDPKERKTLFLVQLEQNSVFAVPKNYKLVAAPLEELYGQPQRYGQIISTLPHMLSQFQFQYL